VAPGEGPEQLVALGSNRQNGPYLYCYKIYAELRDRNTVFSGLFARNWFEFYFDAGGETETLNVEMVSGITSRRWESTPISAAR